MKQKHHVKLAPRRWACPCLNGVFVFKYVVNSVLSKESTQVLDCGCGVGYGVVFVARSQGRSVVGVDASETAIQHATARVRQLDFQKAVDLVRCDVLSLPLKSCLFDAAFCVLSIDAFQDLESPLNEVANVVKHSGKLIVADLDPATLSMITIGKIIQYLDRKSGHPYKLHRSTEIGKELSKRGFTQITEQRKHFGFSPPIYIVAAKKTYCALYFNNHFHDYAPENCLYMLRKLGLITEQQRAVEEKTRAKQANLSDFLRN